MKFDLVIKGGTVVSPGSRSGKLDVAKKATGLLRLSPAFLLMQRRESLTQTE